MYLLYLRVLRDEEGVLRLLDGLVAEGRPLALRRCRRHRHRHQHQQNTGLHLQGIPWLLCNRYKIFSFSPKKTYVSMYSEPVDSAEN